MSWKEEIGGRLCHDLFMPDTERTPAFELTSEQLEDIPGEVLRYLPTWRRKFPEALGEIGKRIDGVAQQARIRQNRGLQEGAKIIDAFQQQGIEVAVCKGVSAMSLCGWSPGERICQDVDLLIHPAKAAEAFELIRSLGWTERLARAEIRFILAHQVDWTHPFGGRLNLQWALVEEAPGVDLVEAALSRKIPLGAGWEVLGHGLHPEDQLFQTAVYGRDGWKGRCLKTRVELPRMIQIHGGVEPVRSRLLTMGLEGFAEVAFSEEPGDWRRWAHRRERFQRRFGMLGVYHSWYSEHRKGGELDLPNFGTWLVQYLGGEGLMDLPRLAVSGVKKRLSR